MPETVDLPVDVTRNEEMSDMIDLPVNVAASILKEGSESHQALMTDIRHNGATVHNLARLGATRRFNELDVTESRAVSGVLATPIASPTTKAGA